jgi:hypothetical protein
MAQLSDVADAWQTPTNYNHRPARDIGLEHSIGKVNLPLTIQPVLRDHTGLND